MKYVVNRQLNPGCAIVTLNLDGFGKVQVGNIAMVDPELVKAYNEAMEGYLSPSQGYAQYYAAERLVRRFGGNIEKMEIGENVGGYFVAKVSRKTGFETEQGRWFCHERPEAATLSMYAALLFPRTNHVKI